MYIINTNEGTATLYEPWMSELADVDDPVDDLPGDERGITFDRPTQVTQELGEQLIDRHTAIERYEADSGDTTEDDQ